MAKKDKGLNEKQQAFVEHYLVTMNATEAARLAGYSERSARSTASTLLTNPNIQNLISERKKAKELEFGLSRIEVLREIGALAFTDITDLVVVNGEDAGIKDLEALPRHMKKAIKKIVFRTTTTRIREKEEVHTTTTIELHDKLKALELLGKHFGVFDGDGDDNDKGRRRTDAKTILDAARRAAQRGG